MRGEQRPRGQLSGVGAEGLRMSYPVHVDVSG